MSANQLPISNIINVSVTQPSPGLLPYNTSNLALFTTEAPNLNTFGSLGYAVYLSPTQVGVDFGTGSRTYGMASAVFSQQPNILNGGGALVVVLLTNAVNHLAFSGTPASGTFEFSYGGNATAAINWNDTAAQIQTKLQAVSGLSEVTVTGTMGTTLNIQMAGIYAPSALTTTANSLMTSAPAAITITVTTPTAAGTLPAAITAASSLVQFFGIIEDHTVAEIGQTDLLAAAAVVQALTKVMFVVSHTAADIAVGGMLDLLRSGSFTQSRGLYYGDTNFVNCVNMMAAYAGLGLSVNFNGSNTTITMNLKTLQGILPDPTITQTQLTLAEAAGVDTYVSLQGVSAVICAGTNQFYDAVYNQLWLAGALQVAGFNYLAQSSTKIPQTESGMDGLKGALRSVMEQAVQNQYLAPGTWNSSVTFGNQALFLQNISQKGYYIYSSPVAQQLQANRAARQSPPIQIAAKSAGAVQSASIIVYVSA